MNTNFPQYFPQTPKCVAPATRLQRIRTMVERRGLEPRTLCLQIRFKALQSSPHLFRTVF
jgi:hypothetical protein